MCPGNGVPFLHQRPTPPPKFGLLWEAFKMLLWEVPAGTRGRVAKYLPTPGGPARRGLLTRLLRQAAGLADLLPGEVAEDGLGGTVVLAERHLLLDPLGRRPGQPAGEGPPALQQQPVVAGILQAHLQLLQAAPERLAQAPDQRPGPHHACGKGGGQPRPGTVPWGLPCPGALRLI